LANDNFKRAAAVGIGVLRGFWDVLGMLCGFFTLLPFTIFVLFRPKPAAICITMSATLVCVALLAVARMTPDPLPGTASLLLIAVAPQALVGSLFWFSASRTRPKHDANSESL